MMRGYEVSLRYRRALGDDSSSFSSKVQQLEERIRQFNTTWKASGITDAKVPPAFVLDLLSSLLREVISPFTSLKIEMLKKISNVFVAEEINLAGNAVGNTWSMKLLPVMMEAIRQKAAGATFMAVVIPNLPPGYSLARYVNVIIQTVIDGYERLAELEEIKPWFLKMGGVSDGMLTYLVGAGQMVEQAKRVIAAAGEIIYKPIAAALDFADLLVKGSMVAAGLWILWKLTND